MDHNSKKKSTLDSYIVHHTLGCGSTSKVKLVESPYTHEIYAAKVIKLSQSFSPHYYRTLLLNEVRLLRQVSHKNIIKLYNYKESGSYISKSKGFYTCMYMILEYCTKGELFEILKKNGSLTEEVTLFYFKQMVSALELCSDLGFVHGDLKPENVLIGQDFEVKIIDFGNSFGIRSRNWEFLGTELYLPPEVRSNSVKDPVKADLFVLGIILFIMYVGCPPFHKANLDDKLYFCIANRDTTDFWNFFARKHPDKVFTSDFKALIEGLLEYDTEKRFNYEGIKKNNWFLTEITLPTVITQLQKLVNEYT